jgi:hypothetical protein
MKTDLPEEKGILMAARLTLLGHLKYFVPDRQREQSLSHGLTIDEVVDRLHIPRESIMGFYSMGNPRDGSYVLKDGDVIEAVPYITGG